MNRDYEAIAAQLVNLDTNADWQSAAREVHEAVVQILQRLTELQDRITKLEDQKPPPPNRTPSSGR